MDHQPSPIIIAASLALLAVLSVLTVAQFALTPGPVQQVMLEVIVDFARLLTAAFVLAAAAATIGVRQ